MDAFSHVVPSTWKEDWICAMGGGVRTEVWVRPEDWEVIQSSARVKL